MPNSGATGTGVLSLIFAEGSQPDARTIAALAELPVSQVDPKSLAFSIAHLPGDDAEWLELLAGGLTFDCLGLAPGPGMNRPERGVLLGLQEEPERCASIELVAGPHLKQAAAMLPVLRSQIGLALRLAELPGLEAICWQPARSWMEPGYFRKIATAWLDGGAFPALGLVTFDAIEGGALCSTGLRFLIGQELRIESGGTSNHAALVRIAVRLIHELVQAGPVTEPIDFTGPESQNLKARPTAGGTMIEVTVAR